MRKLYLGSVLVILIASILTANNSYGESDCTRVRLKLKNHTNIILEKVSSLNKCSKPSSKYRLKACIQRKQEGSKGFNCSLELSERLKGNEKYNCKGKINSLKNLLRDVESFTNDYEVCLEQKP